MNVILIGGTQATGKTKIASKLAKTLNISHIISTEQIKDIVKSIISKDQLPSLYENVLNIKNNISNINNDKIWGYLRQTMDLKPCIEAIINNPHSYKDTTIIEGTHLIPGVINFPSEVKVIHFILYQPNEILHSKLLNERNRYQIEDYSKIRTFQEYLISVAEKNNAKLINSEDTDSCLYQILASLDRKTLVFDLLGGIFHNKSGDNLKSLYDMLPNKTNTFEKFQERYKLFVIGKITRAEFWDKTTNDFETIEKKYLSTYKFNYDLQDFIENNTDEYRFIALTNHPKEWTNYLIEKFELNKYFEKFYISGELKLQKPQKAIYKMILRDSNISTNNILVIDDQKKNLKTAHELGFKTIYIDNHTEFDNFEVDVSINSINELKDKLRKII
ncbi:HAD-IA family hydrolase [Candidatus Dojkabacteria bacterium]|nr:HAD-IA family hydrolase [Candidatus Dojkabacteria bacterium]